MTHHTFPGFRPPLPKRILSVKLVLSVLTLCMLGLGLAFINGPSQTYAFYAKQQTSKKYLSEKITAKAFIDPSLLTDTRFIVPNLQQSAYTYLPKSDAYTTMLSRKSLLVGVLTKRSIDRTLTTNFCSFKSPSSFSLKELIVRAIKSSTASTPTINYTVNPQDVYSYCADGSIRTVIPLLYTERHGFSVRTLPGGVAIYSDNTQSIAIHTQVVANTIPGPVFPASLARTLLSTTQPSFPPVYLQNKKQLSKYPRTFEKALDPRMRTEDWKPEGFLVGQHASLILKNTDAAGYVRALSVLPVDAVQAGELPRISMYRLSSERPPVSALTEQIHRTYATFPGVVDMDVLSTTPLSLTRWQVNVGFKGDVRYVVYLNSQESSCLTAPNLYVLKCV